MKTSINKTNTKQIDLYESEITKNIYIKFNNGKGESFLRIHSLNPNQKEITTVDPAIEDLKKFEGEITLSND